MGEKKVVQVTTVAGESKAAESPESQTPRVRCGEGEKKTIDVGTVRGRQLSWPLVSRDLHTIGAKSERRHGLGLAG